MDAFCRHCGSPSWRNGPCWFEHVARKQARDAGREFDLKAFCCGGDPPCVWDYYEESQAERRREKRRGWLVFAGVIAAIVGIGFLLAGCDDKWPQEKRQCEAVNGLNHGC